jgi:DNA replication protein DnaC
VDGGELEGVSRYGDGAEWIESLCKCPFLVLDDLGSEKDTKTGDVVALVERIVRARHNDNRRTVMTSNMTGEAFKKQYDERLVRRIRDAGRVVDCNYDAKALKQRMQEKRP